MLGFLRLMFVLLVVQTIIYALAVLYARERQRDKLKQRWAEKGLTGDRTAFIQRGMSRYDQSLQRKLLLLIYAIPFGALALLIYIVNFM
ncbi:hypothetical protein [Phaeobacter sp.]|uniref:hypothetical protein n=1 Tax=Phaeobacter sp. TaxID=1902409 RepID=UPI0025DF1431|nr:hypothetical protein [Phaeobacter sp.]